MKGTFTFTDGESNQMNLSNTCNSEAKGINFLFAKDFFRKVKQLFVHGEIIEPRRTTAFIRESINNVQLNTIPSKNDLVGAGISGTSIKNESYYSHLNYKLNIKQMNFFTYLIQAITGSEQSLSGQFLEQFKNFLSVIVGTASEKSARFGYLKGDFGILSNFGGFKLLSKKNFDQSFLRSWGATVMFLMFFTTCITLAKTGSMASLPDVSVKKTINTQSPTIGQDVIYTINVRNDGAIKATGVALTDVLPDGVTFKSASVGGVGVVNSYTTSGITTLTWNIGEVPATATNLTMTIVATVVKRGLFFNVAEITSETETDLDSKPNNHDINEDDQDAVCFSVAEYFYKGDEFKIGLPTGYTNINWTIKIDNGSAFAITSTTSGVSLNSRRDTLTVSNITGYTEFAFTATNKNCPVGGCCPAKFMVGPTGTIGDFVFIDANGNNKQDVGEIGLSGVTVELYDATGTTKLQTTYTDVNGSYIFQGLESGGYRVKFILPSGKTFVTPNVGSSVEDSDAGFGGFSGVIYIDVTKPIGDIGRNNSTIDAGVKVDCNIYPGTLATSNPNVCLPTNGSVVLASNVAIAPTVPMGYSLRYVLTKGAGLVIQQVSNTPTFTVSGTGEYRIHTLVYDGNSSSANFLNLSVIQFGITTGADVAKIISDNKLCAALDVTGIKFNINEIPVAPMVAGAIICDGSLVTLGKTSLGTTAKWYSSANATFPFRIDSTISVNPTISTTYYVSVVNSIGCESLRYPVTVTVNPKPQNPLAKSSLTNDCTQNLLTVNLANAITSIPFGNTIEWHVTNNVASAIITNPTAVGAGTYYAFAKSTAGCYSFGVAVTVTINSCICQNPATVSIAPIAAVCGNTSSMIQLSATIGGGATSGIWTSNGTGTFDNAASLTPRYTPSTTDVMKGSVEFKFTTNDPDGADPKCSAASGQYTLTFKAKPLPPTSLKCDQMICLGSSNKLFSVSQGNVVKWYASASSNTPIGIATDEGFVVTPTSEGIYTYYVDATTPEGCVSERSSISFTVKKCLTDLAVNKNVFTPDLLTTPNYLLGQTAVYTIEAQNIGDANATDVKVNDFLPFGATYVNSTPTGEYNSSTGIWTIGNLAKGSSKSLLIQVTIGKTGSITNIATISGTNEDPTKLANNTSTVAINVVDIADLSLTKTVNKSVVNTGGEVEYTITVLNSGPNTATNVEVKDKLPLGLTFLSSSTLTENAGVLTGTAPSIAKGAKAVFTFKAKVNSTGKITNVAEISKSDQKDPDSTPGNASTKPDEDDTDNVDINSTSLCNLDKPTIACGCTQKTICLGGDVTLVATGCPVGSTYIWSNGDMSSSITVRPRTSQTYTVYCQKDNCKSESSNAVEVKVIVVDSPLLSASPSKVCMGESTILTAKGCAGTIEWQTSPMQTGSQITVTPTFSQTYKALCKQFDCVSPLATVDVLVTPTPIPPVIVSQKLEICPKETVTMTAMNCNGQVKWSTGQETTSITVFPSVTTSYTVTCSVNGCTSTSSIPYVLTVKPIAVPTIKASNLVVCTGASATLMAEGCNGNVTWYYGDKTLTGASITVTPTTSTTYSATCTSMACISDKSSSLTVQVVNNPSAPTITSGISTICAGSSVELTAAGCTGTVKWSDGQTGSVITVKPLVSTLYTATCSIGTCISDVSIGRNITVTDITKPTLTADKLTICVGNSVSLTANGCNGTVKWSDGILGSSRIVVPTTDVKYTATCESGTCKSDVSNEIVIKVNNASQAPVISSNKTEICAGESITLSAAGCNGTVKWSDGSTGITAMLKPTVSTTYSAICTVGTCDSPKSNERTITVNPSVVLKLVASTSSPQICVGNETTLTLSGCTGIITWTGGMNGASIKVKPTETTTYTATCSGVACATDASTSVKVNVLIGATTPTITSTNTQICSGAEVTLTVNNCNGTLLWSNGASTSSITVKPTVTTIYSVKCTVDGCGDGKTSEPLTVKVGTPNAPTITSVSSSVCAGGTVSLTALGCTSGTVVWSNGKTGITLSETVNATTTYSAICKQGGTCNSPESNKLTVSVTVPSVPTISCETNTICPGSSVTLYASGCEGTVKWSDGQTGAIVKASPTQTTNYTATCTVGTCTSSPSSVATVNVGNPPAPTVTCNATSICQGIQITLTATNCLGTIVWSDGQVGNVITAKPNTTTTYTSICKLDKCESGKSNAITVTVGATINKPTTKNLNNVCPFLTVDLASGVTSSLSAGGVFEYRTGVLPTSALVSNPNAVGTGTYYVFEKTGTGCYSSPGVINTYINSDCTPIDCAKTPAKADAGADATICAEKVYKLSGTFGGSATSILWKTTGTGTFDNPLSPTATYRSSLADVLAGTVKLILCTNDPDGNGPCLAKADTMVLTMIGVKFKPLLAVNGNLNSCGTDSVTLTATAGYAYLWYKVGTIAPIATTRSITVKSSGEYFFKLVDPNKCCSIQSDTASVNYLSIPNAPVANSVKIDLGTTIDLNKLVVSNLPSGTTLVFKTGTSSASTTVANPSAVGPGTYYAFYKNAQGCYSQSTKITVENKLEGTTIPLGDKANLTILLLADKQSTTVNDLITFTISVTNNGPIVANNVVVDNILPKFLTFQSGDPFQKGDTLRVVTASIPVGNTVTITYKAKVNRDTIISNTAKIMNVLSPIDTILTKYVSTVVLVPAADTTYSDLGVSIVANAATYKVGDNITYTITLTNNGAGFAKNVQLCNPIPTGLTYISGTGIIKAGDSLIIKNDTISKGKTSTFTYTVKANTAGNISNTVRICNSSKGDLITPNNTSTSSITVNKNSEIVPTTCTINLAMAIVDTAKISDGVYNVTYRLIAKNVCKDTLKNVTLYSDLEKTFKTANTYQIIGKPSTGVKTNLITNDLFSKTDSSIVKAGSYMLPNAIDTVKYVVKVSLSSSKGPFVSNLTIDGKTTANENLTAKAKEILRFDLPSTRIGLAKEVAKSALKNDSTTYWTVPYRIRVVNMGVNAITKLSVKDSLDEMFTAKGAIIIGKPTVTGTQGLTINKKYTGKGLFTDLLIPDSSSLAKGDTAIIDMTVRVNVANAPDAEKIFNNVAVGTGTGTDKMTYKDISTNGTNPDTNGDNDPMNDNVATPVQLKGQVTAQQVVIGLALASLTDTIQLADSTCNVTLIMIAKNYGKDNLRNVKLSTNIQKTIGKQSTSWNLVGSPTVIKGNVKISSTFNGTTDSTITKSDSSSLAVGDSIVIAYMVNIKGALKDTIYTQAIANALSAEDMTKSTSDFSTNGLKPDTNGDGKPSEASLTPIICKNATLPTLAFIPDGFSPNGDGINDVFRIQGLKSTELNELIIFNRWGGVVYASPDYQNNWAGEANQGVVAIGSGQGLPDGTYFYSFTRYAKGPNGEKGDKVAPEKTKSITLIR